MTNHTTTEGGSTRSCRICGRRIQHARLTCPRCADLLARFAPAHEREATA